MASIEDVPAEAQVSGLIRWSRIAVVVLARLVTIGVVVQIFLVGLSLFESADYWEDHKSFGGSLGLIPILLILVALVGRLPMRLIVMAALLLVLFGVQYALPNVDNGYVSALHPLNALVLLGLSDQIAKQTRGLGNRTQCPTRSGSRRPGTTTNRNWPPS
jgi:hypothetical protein